jgi:hypothetical protein
VAGDRASTVILPLPMDLLGAWTERQRPGGGSSS